jgi:hypothetical protein
MNENIQLKVGKLPRAMGALVHSNQFLKMTTVSTLGLCVLLACLLYVSFSKPPTVLAMNSNAELYNPVDLPKPEREVEEAIRHYIDHRYKWDPQSVTKRLQEAEAFVLPQNRNAYEKAMADVVRFSTEKAASQRVYPEKLTVDLKNRTVAVFGDRVTAIQGLKAAGDLRIELSFESGPRTDRNPWGIYITKEREG